MNQQPQVMITYDEAKTKDPLLVDYIVEQLRQSRSKFKDSSPQKIQWFYTWATEDDNSEEIWGNTEFPEYVPRTIGSIHLGGTIGQWSLALPVLGLPELVCKAYEPRKPRELKEDSLAMVIHNDLAEDEDEKNVVWEILGAYRRQRLGQEFGSIKIVALRLLEDPNEHLPHLFTLEREDDKLVSWSGAMITKAWEHFQKTKEGELFLYRNLKFDRLTRDEIIKAFPGVEKSNKPVYGLDPNNLTP